MIDRTRMPSVRPGTPGRRQESASDEIGGNAGRPTLANWLAQARADGELDETLVFENAAPAPVTRLDLFDGR